MKTCRSKEDNMEHLDLVKEVFGRVADNQEDKGIAKYGKPLDPLDDYDWLQMALEESVDGTKYLIAEMEKRKFIAGKIRKLLNYKPNEVSKTEILHWLDVLEGK